MWNESVPDNCYKKLIIVYQALCVILLHIPFMINELLRSIASGLYSFKKVSAERSNLIFAYDMLDELFPRSHRIKSMWQLESAYVER